MRIFKRLNWVIQRYFAPTIVGLENIPDEPTLLSATTPCLGWTA